MRRALLRNASLYTHHLLRPSPPVATSPKIAPPALPFSRPLLASRFCSSGNDSSGVTVAAPKLDIQAAEEAQKQVDFELKDVSDKELRTGVNKFMEEFEPSDARKALVDAVISRLIAGRDDECVVDYIRKPKKSSKRQKPPKGLPGMSSSKRREDIDEDLLFDHHLDQIETDSDIDDLCNVRETVEGRFRACYLHMDDKKWDELIKEQTGEGYSELMQECTDILDDMKNFDQLLPDEIKKKVLDKLEELGARCERGELKPKEAFELFSKFEEEIINEHLERTEAEGPPLSDKTVAPYKTNEPPGEGPILRWQTRVVFCPGDKSWHPKNRKVKLSVTVKELGLTKHQFRRLRSLVGKRYHPGRDELMITSERFEHREENRKDCLRTMLSLIEEAGKAEKLVEDARASYVKERLKANPAFMERLNAKIMRLQGQRTVPALTSA